MKLSVAKIREDGGTQARAELELDAVQSYAEAMRRGDEFPPVVVFYDGKEYWLADGFHRVAAAVDASILELEADVRLGTRRDAVLFSVGANAVHGVRRTYADKRRAVSLLLADAEWSLWSERSIAKACRVSHTFVAKVKAGTETLRAGNDSTPRTTEGGNESRPLPIGAPASGTVVRGNERDSLPPSSTDILHLSVRLEDRLESLTTDICEAPVRVQRAIAPALDVALRRLARVVSGTAA